MTNSVVSTDKADRSDPIRRAVLARPVRRPVMMAVVVMQATWLIFVAVSLVGCAVNPVTGQQEFVLMSESQELAAGRQANQQVLQQYDIYPDQQLQFYVNEIGQRLAKHSHRPELTYQFTVVDSTEINAFALPGGYIYITRGLLAYLNSEAELAAVLGHEIGHVTARHGVRQQTSAQAANVGAGVLSVLLPELAGAGLGSTVNMLGTALLRGYGREHELEADRLGADYLKAAGYDPRAMFGVIRTLKEHELFDRQLAALEGREARAYHGVFATHPDNDTRLREITSYADQVNIDAEIHRDRFLDELDGMMFGPNPAAGIFRGNTFLHPDMGFALTFPENWRVANRPDRLLAVSPNQDAQLQVMTKPVGADGSPNTILRALGIGQLTNEQRLLNGAITGAAMATSNGETKPVRIGAIVIDGRGYVIVGLTSQGSLFPAQDPNFVAVIKGFHRISDDERKLARGQRLRIVRLKGAVSWDALSRSSPLEPLAEPHLRLLNAAPNNTPNPQTQRIKVIE